MPGKGGAAREEFKHTEKTPTQLEKALIESADAKIDWSKGVVPQINKLGDEYYAWVDGTYKRKRRLKLFDNPIMEFLTKTPWWIPATIWLPISIICWDKSREELSFSTSLSYFIIGLIWWRFTEYSLHRWVFHSTIQHPIARNFHFLLHGLHHLAPLDEYRLVFPPIGSIPIALIVTQTIFIPFGYIAGLAVCSGFFVAYVVYDTIHYAVHHWNLPLPFYHFIRRQHMYHHFHDPTVNFDVNTTLLDFPFGTIHIAK